MGGGPWRGTLCTPIKYKTVCITGFIGIFKPGSAFTFCIKLLVRRTDGVRAVSNLTIHNNVTHAHITSTCLLCCITGSKERRPFPKIKKLYN